MNNDINNFPVFKKEWQGMGIDISNIDGNTKFCLVCGDEIQSVVICMYNTYEEVVSDIYDNKIGVIYG